MASAPADAPLPVRAVGAGCVTLQAAPKAASSATTRDAATMPRAETARCSVCILRCLSENGAPAGRLAFQQLGQSRRRCLVAPCDDDLHPAHRSEERRCLE